MTSAYVVEQTELAAYESEKSLTICHCSKSVDSRNIFLSGNSSMDRIIQVYTNYFI